MSSDPRSDAPSPEPETAGEAAGPQGGTRTDAELVRERGADLLAALEARLPGSLEHAELTARWALAISAELRLPRATALALRETARLHAIGMLYIDAGLAGRGDRERSPEERDAFDAQAEAAARLASGAGLPAAACIWLEHWRERFEGGGPRGLYGGAIPLESRILRAACAYAHELAVDSDPPRALERLGGLAGTELDPATIGAIAFVLDRSAPK
ncbi:MAG TPA: HD domain-containing phosphohydrolase [Solirubrobacterales bacterium]